MVVSKFTNSRTKWVGIMLWLLLPRVDNNCGIFCGCYRHDNNHSLIAVAIIAEITATEDAVVVLER